MPRSLAPMLVVIATFTAGIFAHVLYQRWNPPLAELTAPAALGDGEINSPYVLG